MSTYPHLDTSMAIGDFHLDCTGRVKTATLCDFLQAAATAHAEILGVGMLDLMKHGITWMLAGLSCVTRYFSWRRKNVPAKVK